MGGGGGVFDVDPVEPGDPDEDGLDDVEFDAPDDVVLVFEAIVLDGVVAVLLPAPDVLLVALEVFEGDGVELLEGGNA